MNKPKLLVIDDEPQIRRLLDYGLSGYGYSVISTDNGA
ncbi:MAG: DNA-binding response regulator, partial [Anaerolinea sp.]|nr:DNA-binding response regulator [Anaerolinea sp.]